MQFTNGKKYAFSIYGNINDQSYFTGTIVGSMFGKHLPPTANGNINHINIYPTLPEEIRLQYKDDFTSYEYVMMLTEAGNLFYIGKPWIIESTVTTLGSRVLEIQIPNFEDENADFVIKTLASRGYEVSFVKISDV